MFQDTDKITVIDAGANISSGADNYTKLILEFFGEKVERIWAFEPVKWDSYEATYGNNDRVTLSKLALDSEAKEIKLFVAKNTSLHQLTSICNRPQFGGAVDEKTVQATSLDDFVEEHEIEHIHILKLDIEGAELKALQGASKLLSENRISVVQLEYARHITGHKTLDYTDTDITEYLKSHGMYFLNKTRQHNPREGEFVYVHKSLFDKAQNKI